jgi:UDP-4-amino-4,6-dideoxy-N-acetyl-beta-L-altrosamine N-acetyltransferase
MTADDLELVRRWRNRPEVRAHMFTRHEIGAEEHRAFFARALVDPTARYLVGVDAAGAPLGVVGFTGIHRDHRTADWGFYVGDTAPRGTGTALCRSGLDHAFDDLGLEKVSGEVLDGNVRSLRLHLLLGFVVEGTFRSHHLRDGRRHDVVRLAIDAEAWRVRRPDIERRTRGGPLPPFEPGTRHEGRLRVADPGQALAAVVTALGERFPGPGTTVEALRARFAGALPAVGDPRLTIEVVRRVGRHATLAWTLEDAGGRLAGEADVTLEEVPQ